MFESCAEVFERHHLAVYRYLLRMTGRPDVAEDLTQEVFLRVMRRADTYEERGTERAWVTRIARHLLIDHQRKERRQPEHVVADTPARAISAEGDLAVREALLTLAEPDREALLMRAVLGLGHDEIASLTGATPASVRSRLHRARRDLRPLLAPVSTARPKDGL
jgi:RNA polymerase sigma factor (sigma-70 family)